MKQIDGLISDFFFRFHQGGLSGDHHGTFQEYAVVPAEIVNKVS